MALRTLATVEMMHHLTEKNLDRLRRWEPWAQGAQTESDLATFTEFQLGQFARGAAIPTVIFRGDEAVGSASLKLDAYLATAELGYWIDRDEEGKGIVSRACTALIEHARDIGSTRVEIRTAALNERSCRVAERLGFEREGFLRGALPIGEIRLDVALYGLVE
ncbi:GNAT family N-acetyltransferase [Agreia bicolorata]|uniref:GNAT family N-acetyltransferase n=1 Tax=Agreia bicolorata TaxID=110935 RepID=UPI0005C90B22|nr:GNAT family protein [Agreia bicolorata]